jgi:putative flippase GtrA
MPVNATIRLAQRLTGFFFRDPRLFLRYITVGAGAALIELTLFSLLYEVADWPLLGANGVALVLAIGFAFTMQKLWTFRVAGSGSRQLRWYLFMQAISAILNNLLMVLFVQELGWYAPLAKVIQIGLVFLWNFTFCRLVVFARAPAHH